MRFIYTNQQIILEDGNKNYKVPFNDLERLLMRPGTRVLRFEEEGEIVSIPLTTAIGEIEGYSLLQDALKDTQK